MSQSKPIVLTSADWNTSAIKYMAPKVNDRGAKTISVISKQTNRSLHVSTPLLMTWGVSDFVDEKGESDGKYSISLNFPNSEYANASTTIFLQKLKDFENQILDDAVRNSEAWFGEEMSREVAKHTFFPFLKYSKDKVTKKIDPTKAPSIRAKVPNYGGRWAVEIYDTSSNLIFPCDNENMTPMDFIPKKSNVACVLQCGGLWFGGKGWGLTWKLTQCVVKPHEVLSVFGRCHIQLSADELSTMEKQPDAADDDADEEQVAVAAAPISTVVADSDDEAEAEVAAEPEPAPAPAVKKVVKKAVVPAQAAAPVPAPVPVPVPVQVQSEPEPEAAAEPAKKKVVKKKV